ncbi:M23 family metallopeptidase [Saprospiraceae bacterium]|nr:M23 family metallopeptidase [Saprospiraceae bacterium]
MEDYSYIRKIVTKVNELNITDLDYREEIIDHYCSFYEEQLKELDQADALDKTLRSIVQQDLYKPQKNNKLMVLKIASVLSIVLSFSLYLAPENTSETTATMETNFVDSEIVALDPPYGMPLEANKITSGFGDRMHPTKKVLKFHKGVDFSAPIGTKVISVEAGRVLEVGEHKMNGKFIVIKHDEEYTTRYLHLSKIDVVVDQVITKGDKIGEVGNTGQSLRPHLHYEIIKEGKPVDPNAYLKA